MKSRKLVVYLKAVTIFVLLAGLLWSSTSVSQIIESVAQELQRGASLTLDGSHDNLKRSVPVENKNAEPQAEKEIRAEEEDTTEKDQDEPSWGLLYEFNPTWVKISSCSDRALVRIAGANALYVLHHSWKSCLN